MARLDGDTMWRVEASVPSVGHAILLASRPWVRTFGVWLAVAALLALALRAIWRAPQSGTDDAALAAG